MKSSEVNKLAEKIPNKEILELIDIKIENDMKEVINKIEQFQNQNHSEFKRLEDKIGMILWAIGILIALIIALKFFAD
jgi:DNA polymerase III gamma/tau subunit